jgi:hypothetical protein
MALQKNPKKKFLPKSLLINGKGKRKTTITFTEFESIQTPFGQAKKTQTTKRQRERQRERKTEREKSRNK